MRLRIAASSVVGVLLLAIFGAVMGPAWSPQPMVDQIDVATTDARIGRPAQGSLLGRYEVERTVVPVHLDGVDVEATVYMPKGVVDPVPGVVFVHGAGTGRHESAFAEHANALASAGIAAIVPDKRRDTYSLRHRDYELMALDYARTVAVLRAFAGVDPARVGIYGESEGCWILPVMAASDPTLAFTIFASAPVVPPREQAAYAIDAYLRNTGVPNSVFRAIPRAVGMAFPGGGFEYADFDVQPFQRRMTQPVLMAYGTRDQSMPTVQGAQQMIGDLALAGNTDYTVRYYAGANHGIRVGGASHGARVDGVLHPDYLADLAGWLTGLPGSARSEPRIAGATPHQTYLAAPVPGTRWFGNGDVVLATVLGGAGLIVLFPTLLLLGVLARRKVRLARGLIVPLLGTCVGSLASVLGLVIYLVSVARIAMDYERNAMAVKGGWIGVRLLGIATVVVAVILVERLRDIRADTELRVAAGPLGTVALATGVGGSVLLLLSLAYWGVFQLGI